MAWGCLGQKRVTVEILHLSCACKLLERHFESVCAQTLLQKVLAGLLGGWDPGICF